MPGLFKAWICTSCYRLDLHLSHSSSFHSSKSATCIQHPAVFIPEIKLLPNQVIDTRLLELWLTGGGRPELLICHLNCNAIISSTDDQANVTAFKIWHTKPRQNQIIRSIIKTSVHLKKKNHIQVDQCPMQLKLKNNKLPNFHYLHIYTIFYKKFIQQDTFAAFHVFQTT